MSDCRIAKQTNTKEWSFLKS